MDHIKSLNELVFDLDDVSVKDIHKFAKEFLLITHFYILIDLLENWHQISLVDIKTDII